jgi:hypothetical protein
MQEYEVRFECFPVTMVDKSGTALPDLDYYIFHSLEGIIDALDKEASEWQGSSLIGVPRVVLDHTKFEHRPMFVCADVFVDLVRDDLKREIEKRGMSGFEFFRPEEYPTGRHRQGILLRRNS